MTEQLLQYIWEFRFFNDKQLTTTENLPVEIIHAGTHNTNQGPDFLGAKIKIGTTTWAGNVELHIYASQWKAHNHSQDINYRNVILHVVWEEDEALNLSIPTVVLSGRISSLLLDRYADLMANKSFVPCQSHLPGIRSITLSSWKERLLVERLQQKSTYIQELLAQNNFHWEETFWWMLARNFGVNVNSEAFEMIARSIPLNILAKHKNQLIQLEALLLGQGGLLNKSFTDSYPRMLRKEYLFLQAKYALQPAPVKLFFLRMRPANFPSLRLAQLAALIQKSKHLFSWILETQSLEEVYKMLMVTANDYWHYHYVPDDETVFKSKTLGQQMIQNIIINTIIPVLYAYGFYHSKESVQHKALQWLEQLPPELNSITKGYTSLGLQNKSAFDSQAYIQLKNNYCNQKNCLHCAIGNRILKEA